MLADRFGVGLGTAALSGTAFGLGYGSGFLGIGVAADRLERRATIAGALAAASAFTLLAGLAGGFGLFLAVRFLAGFCAAGFAPACYAYVSAHIAPEQRAGRFAVIMMGFLSAGALGQVYAAAVEPWLGVTGVYVVLAALLALAAGLHRVWLAPQPAPPGTESLRAAYAHLGEIDRHAGDAGDVPRVGGRLRRLRRRLRGARAAHRGRARARRRRAAPDPRARDAGDRGGRRAGRARRRPARADDGGARRARPHRRRHGARARSPPRSSLQVASTLLVAGGIGLTMPTLLAYVASLPPPQALASATALNGLIVFTGASVGQPLGTAATGAAFAPVLLAIAALVALSGLALRRG